MRQRPLGREGGPLFFELTGIHSLALGLKNDGSRPRVAKWDQSLRKKRPCANGGRSWIGIQETILTFGSQDRSEDWSGIRPRSK